MMPRERISFLKAERTQARNGEQLTEWVPASKELTNVGLNVERESHLII